MLTAKEVAELLRLAPLPREGGLFRETYIRRGDPNGPAQSTAIYYMLIPGAFSHLHKLADDEIYHFYLGSPVELLLLYPDGSSRLVTLGADLAAGQLPQCIVPAGVWQGSSLAPGGAYALMGTTMAPGYAPEGYIHGEREALIAQYPGRAAHIKRLTEAGPSERA